MNFSKFYDIFQKDVDYAALLEPILPFLDHNETILDAGCGSGHIMLTLTQMNFKVIGIDNDESMLLRAYKNFDVFNLKPNLFVHDLRKPLKHKFNQIISLLDVFHYFKGIKGVAKNLYDALYPGGKLIIDLYQAPQYDQETGKIDDILYDWTVETTHHLMIHDIKAIHQGHMVTYQVKQYYYEPTYYLDVLSSLGFKLEVFEGFDDRKIYVVCTK